MNYIGIIVLVIVLAHFSLNIFSEILNLRNLTKEIPKGFEDWFDGEKYTKSQEYIITNTKFSIVSDSFDLVVFLIFWLLGGFGVLDEFIRGFNLSPILSGLLYIGILSAGKSLIDLPFSIYGTFVIEEKFGFNKTTPILYFTDKLKMLVIGVLIGAPVLAGILWFFEYTGSFAWLYCFGALSVFVIVMQVIVPVWIMPLFNKFTPLEDGELRDAVLKYAGENDFPLANVFVMDGSKRSGKSNAFFAGFGKTKRLVFFDTIIKNHSIDEMIAVIAHETGHFKKKHIISMTILGIIQSGIMFYLLSFFISFKDLFTAFHVQEISVYAGIVFFGMLYSPVDFFVGLGMMIFSRKNEFEADEYAAKTIEDKNSLITALKRLSSDNYSNLTPHPFYVFLNYSHPPVIKRIERIAEVS